MRDWIMDCLAIVLLWMILLAVSLVARSFVLWDWNAWLPGDWEWVFRCWVVFLLFLSIGLIRADHD